MREKNYRVARDVGDARDHTKRLCNNGTVQSLPANFEVMPTWQAWRKQAHARPWLSTAVGSLLLFGSCALIIYETFFLQPGTAGTIYVRDGQVYRSVYALEKLLNSGEWYSYLIAAMLLAILVPVSLAAIVGGLRGHNPAGARPIRIEHDRVILPTGFTGRKERPIAWHELRQIHFRRQPQVGWVVTFETHASFRGRIAFAFHQFVQPSDFRGLLDTLRNVVPALVTVDS